MMTFEKLEIGNEVYWLDDPEYTGKILKIDSEIQKALIEFTEPVYFKCMIPISKIRKIEVEDESKTNLTNKEKQELKEIYIELALATNDKKWFLELTKG